MFIGNLPSPFMAPDGAAGGGAPTGGGGAPGAPAGSSTAPVNVAGGGAPSPITWKDDDLVQPPGYDKPVKYSDFMRGYVAQSEFTKKAQALAKERQDFEARRQAATEKLIAEARRIAELQRGGQTQTPSMLDEIREAPYVTGKTVAELMEAVQHQGLAPLFNEIRKRDAALGLLLKRLDGMEKALNSLSSHSSSRAFDEKVAHVRSQLGLPDDPEAGEFLRDIYQSHEGDDLDHEFPNIARKRLDGLRRIVREMDRDEARKARERLLPGRGGNASPGQPLRRGFKSPEQLADEYGALFGLHE